MRMPDALSSLVDEGIIEEVLRPLMSGKEAQIYLVVAGGKQCVAKIYKEAQNRTFKHRANYTEGRKVRNSRDQRAIDKRSKHGRGQDEAAWRSTEVDMIYRLQAAGVRVPAPYQFIDGVLVMELVTGANGEPAPRLGEVDFTAEQATAVHERLLREVVRMLCAGVVHGDLSDFNVLMGTDGPVIIDLPQAVDPSKNQNARKLLLRDVDNLQRFLSRFVPSARRAPYAEEMWSLYERNQLTPETVLRGQYQASQKKADTGALLELIGEVNEDERRRLAATKPQGARPRRVEINVDSGHLSSRRSPSNHKPAAVVRGTPTATSDTRRAPPRHVPPPPSARAPAPPRPAPGGASRHPAAAAPPRPAPAGASRHPAAAAPLRPAPAGASRHPAAAAPLRPAPAGASRHPAAAAPLRPAEPQQAAPPARRRRRRRSRQNGAAAQLTNGNGASVGERPEPSEQARPQRPLPPQRPAAEAGRQAANEPRQRSRPRNPQRQDAPAGSGASKAIIRRD
jgi:RIO kinase 1